MKLFKPKYAISTFTVIFSLFAFTVNAQIITTVVGNGTANFSGDGGLATAAGISPMGVCLDKQGNMYIAEQGHGSIRKVDINGNISTVAGTGQQKFYYTGDGGAATSTNLYLPSSVVVDNAGNIYISDLGYYRILKVTTDGKIHTVTGNGKNSYSGDGGLAINATISDVSGMALDKSGNLYIADRSNGRVRMINTSGIITTIAGNGSSSNSGDMGLAIYAGLSSLNGLAFDAAGNLYVAGYQIRKIDTKGIITTIAGTGNSGFSGDGGPATRASFSGLGIAVDLLNNIYISDYLNQRIRKVDNAGIISTVAGTGEYGYNGDSGFATKAKLNNPFGIAVDANGIMYICDYNNSRVRKFNTNILPIVIASINPSTAAQGDTVTLRGQNFTGVTSVTFGGTAATNYTITNDSTIYAVVGNGTSGNIVLTSAKTAGQIQGFTFKLPSTVVSSFSPLFASTGQTVVITGKYFTNAYYVYFGGIKASNFKVINDSTINATVGNGASGSVYVYSYSNGADSLSGFTYLPPPNTDLQVSVSTNIICKNAPVTFTIYNTQSTAMYSVWDSNYNKITKPVQGNGGTLNFVGTIPYNGNYTIEVSNIGSYYTYFFKNTIPFKLENTKSSFVTSKVNVVQNETFNIAATSRDAQTFEWTFGTDANIQTSNLKKVHGLFYPDNGLKTIQLISTSANGCKDTVIDDGVYVYTKPNVDEVCYGISIEEGNSNFGASFAKISLAKDNGFFIGGFGSQLLLRSRYGISKQINVNDMAFFAAYNANGVLRWHIDLKNGIPIRYGSIPRIQIYGSTQDSIGNIYIIGECRVSSYLFLPNGDSIRITRTTSFDDKYPDLGNGFILKVDSLGNYIWHSVIKQTNVSGGIPTTIKLLKDNLYITGIGSQATDTLSYYKDAVNTIMKSFVSTSPYYQQNSFILKIDTSGKYNWSTSISNDDRIVGLDVDVQGNSYILGNCPPGNVYTVIKDVNDSIITLNSNLTNSYLLKLDSSGHNIWHVGFENSYLSELVCDAIGNIYVVGSSLAFRDSIIVRNGSGTVTNLHIQGFNLFKISNKGIVRWGVGNKVAYYGNGNTVCLNKGNLYVGIRNLNNNVSNSSNFTFTSTNSSDISKLVYKGEFVVARYDTSGVLSSLNGSGDNYLDFVNADHIVVDKNDNILISGMIWGSSGVGPMSNVFNCNIPNNKTGEGFLLRLNSNFCSGTTPVTLINFAAVAKQKDVLLNWHTATELNSSHFIIQHSTGGSSFTDIGNVKAIGSGANDYQFVDNSPSNGINFYRLKSVDKDGSFSYSKVVSVQFTVNSNQLTVFPNPAKDKVTIKGNHITSVQVVDNLGRVVKTQNLKDATNPTLSISGLPVGIYHLRIQTTEGKVSGVGFVKE